MTSPTGALLVLSLGLALVACDEGTSETDAGGSGDAGGGSDAGAPVVCGARAGDTCGPAEYCDFPDNQCGAADGTGTCQPRPAGCTDDVNPACGCDGVVHSNPCEAAAAGSDLMELGGCTAPTGTFACGYRFCQDSEYCSRVFDDTGMPTAYHCSPFPSPCDGGGRDCTCVASEPCGDMCAQDGDGNVTLTCPGG